MSRSAIWIDKISARRDGRFTFFQCQEFFTKAYAQVLLNSFPLRQLESVRQPGFSHATISTYRNPQLFREVIAEHKCWQEVCASIDSPDFVRELLLGFGDAILCRYPIGVRTLARKWILNPKRYFSEIQFSVRWTGSILSPHTDNADKVLALIIYFPEAGQESERGGTAFYLPRTRRCEMRVFQRYVKLGWLIPFGLRRLRSTKLPTSDSFQAEDQVREHLEFFDDNYEKILDAPYNLGSAAGFIKNQYSWHDLRLNDFSERAPRRTLLVNVMLRPSRTRALMNVLTTRRRSSSI